MHTPGPWQANWWQGTSQPEIAIHGGGNNQWIADVIVDQDYGEESAAQQQSNAGLIAAAPTMLEALEKLERMADAMDMDDMVNVARAAIAKATGDA